MKTNIKDACMIHDGNPLSWCLFNDDKPSKILAMKNDS